jgi:hypothetical protein
LSTPSPSSAAPWPTSSVHVLVSSQSLTWLLSTSCSKLVASWHARVGVCAPEGRFLILRPYPNFDWLMMGGSKGLACRFSWWVGGSVWRLVIAMPRVCCLATASSGSCNRSFVGPVVRAENWRLCVCIYFWVVDDCDVMMWCDDVKSFVCYRCCCEPRPSYYCRLNV